MCDGYWSICTAIPYNQKCLLHILLVVINYIGCKTCLYISWHFAEMFCQILIGNRHTSIFSAYPFLSLRVYNADHENIMYMHKDYTLSFFQSIFMSRSEIEGFLSTGTLTLHNVSFSQYNESTSNSDQVKYVQDSMRKHWEVLGQWIMEENASVFVCG